MAKMDTIFEREITIYNKVNSTQGRNGTFAEFLQMCAERKGEIEKIRNAGSDEERKRAKSNLSACTPSGTFNGGHSKGNLVKHSGLICIDIDIKENENADKTPEQIMEQLAKWDIVAFASRSASGNGVYAIVKLAHPDKHLEQFMALERLFEEQGITIDKQCSDVSRLRFMSYDSDAFYREDAVEFEGVLQEPKGEKTKINQHATPSSPLRTSSPLRHADNARTLERARICVGEIEKRGVNLCPDYSSWQRMAFAFSTLGEEGRELFNRVAQMHNGKNRATSSKNNTIFSIGIRDNKSITIATFFEACRQNGINANEIERERNVKEITDAVDGAEPLTLQEWVKRHPNTM